MKKLFLLTLLLGGFVIINVQAQCKKSGSDRKACCSKKAAISQTSSNNQNSYCVETTNIANKLACAQKCEMAGLPCKYNAAHFASLNPSVEQKKSTETGMVSYYQKNICAYSGKVSLTSVQFDLNEGKFVDESPKMIDNNLRHCSKICTPEQMTKCKAMGISCKKGAASLAVNDSEIVRP